ncbi:MAG: hypothetical protein IKA58_06965 [Clostridia bacterium]|nr:hypothetical protein [Clostridia bacterium]MBR6653475.1 hypothetical protein [Oscillospiraceae bacterium]
MELLALIQSMSALSIIIFIVGVILLIVEMCTPGFGVAGGLGLVCLVVDIFITAKTFTQGLIMTGIVAVIVVILAVVSIVLVSKGKLPASLMLKDATDKASGYTGGSDKSAYLGKTGKTITELRPAGAAELDGERLDVVSQGGFIESGVDVEVIEVSGNRIVVKAV